jgi:hypothetical protein
MKYLLFIVLLVAVIITAGCVQPGPTKFYPKSTVVTTPTSTECKYNTCNGICYYNGSHQCCGGRVYDIDDGSCCGGIIHDYYKDPGTCCGGKWYVDGTRPKGECCPNNRPFDDFTQNYKAVWINTSTQHCCAGKIVAGGKSIRFGYEWTDCGNSCYDRQTQSCCISWKREKNEHIAVYTVKEGRTSCCQNLSFQIPENNRCNEDGSITENNTGIGDNCKGFSDGSVRCLGPGLRW